MKALSSWLVVGVVGAVLALTGCKREQPIDGVGELRFGKTVRKDWGGQCKVQKDGSAWCQNNPLASNHSVMLGEQNALIGVVFDNNENAAPLAEIELHVSGCRADELLSWLKYRFGDPSKTRDGRAFWDKKLVYIVAKVPPKGIECKVSFLSAKDKKRIAKRTAE